MEGILRDYSPIFIAMALIAGLWIGAFVTYYFIGKCIKDEKEKDKLISDLVQSKNKFLILNQELEEEIRLRDEQNSSG